jgi:hypothetical protein
MEGTRPNLFKFETLRDGGRQLRFLGVISVYTSQSKRCGRSVPVGALSFGYALSIVIRKLGQHWQSRAQKGSTGSFVYCVVYFACFM